MEWLSIIHNLTIVLKIMIKKQSNNQFVMANFTFYMGFYTDDRESCCHQTQIPNMMKIHRLQNPRSWKCPLWSSNSSLFKCDSWAYGIGVTERQTTQPHMHLQNQILHLSQVSDDLCGTWKIERHWSTPNFHIC